MTAAADAVGRMDSRRERRVYDRLGRPKPTRSLGRRRLCVLCSVEVSVEVHGPFRDLISFRDLQVVGLCQWCQDDTYGDGPWERPDGVTSELVDVPRLPVSGSAP